MRLPRLALCALAVAALAAGCSSGGAAAPTSSPAPTTRSTATPSTAAPPTDTAPTPITSPTARPSAVHRKITRPPGARKVDGLTCLSVSNIVILTIEQTIFAVSDVPSQQHGLVTSAQVADGQKKVLVKARKTWLRDGYLPTFPIVRDLDTFIDIYTKLDRAAKAQNLDAVPRLYLDLKSVDQQYVNDTPDNSGVCLA